MCLGTDSLHAYNVSGQVPRSPLSRGRLSPSARRDPRADRPAYSPPLSSWSALATTAAVASCAKWSLQSCATKRRIQSICEHSNANLGQDDDNSFLGHRRSASRVNCLSDWHNWTHSVCWWHSISLLSIPFSFDNRNPFLLLAVLSNSHTAVTAPILELNEGVTLCVCSLVPSFGAPRYHSGAPAALAALRP